VRVLGEGGGVRDQPGLHVGELPGFLQELPADGTTDAAADAAPYAVPTHAPDATANAAADAAADAGVNTASDTGSDDAGAHDANTDDADDADDAGAHDAGAHDAGTDDTRADPGSDCCSDFSAGVIDPRLEGLREPWPHGQQVLPLPRLRRRRLLVRSRPVARPVHVVPVDMHEEARRAGPALLLRPGVHGVPLVMRARIESLHEVRHALLARAFACARTRRSSFVQQFCGLR